MVILEMQTDDSQGRKFDFTNVVAKFPSIAEAFVAVLAMYSAAPEVGIVKLTIEPLTEVYADDDRYVTVAAKPFPSE